MSTPAADSTVAPLSKRLKEGTWDLHQQAESQPFQKDLVQGKVSLAGYAEWLKQMLLIHRELEGHLEALRRRDERVASVVTDEQLQVPYLEADLAALGESAGDLEARPATATIVRKFREASETEPVRLLGYHYVLEGSNNGNTFIARAIRPALGLEPGKGDRYLDPYGDRQRQIWTSFKESIDAASFTEAEQQAMIEAARELFGAISDLSGELAGRSPSN